MKRSGCGGVKGIGRVQLNYSVSQLCFFPFSWNIDQEEDEETFLLILRREREEERVEMKGKVYGIHSFYRLSYISALPPYCNHLVVACS